MNGERPQQQETADSKECCEKASFVPCVAWHHRNKMIVSSYSNRSIGMSSLSINVFLCFSHSASGSRSFISDFGHWELLAHYWQKSARNTQE
jgi:hypothetical protein